MLYLLNTIPSQSLQAIILFNFAQIFFHNRYGIIPFLIAADLLSNIQMTFRWEIDSGRAKIGAIHKRIVLMRSKLTHILIYGIPTHIY